MKLSEFAAYLNKTMMAHGDIEINEINLVEPQEIKEMEMTIHQDRFSITNVWDEEE